MDNETQTDVFILDDDPNTRSYLKKVMSNIGLTCWEFSVASDFLYELKSAHIPRVCFVDINLSRSNIGEGFSVIKAMRNKIHEDIKIFAMSRRNSSEDIQMALKNGADEYVQKPIDVFSLQLQLSRYIEKLSNLKPFSTAIDGEGINCCLAESLNILEVYETGFMLESDFTILGHTRLVLCGELIKEITGSEEITVVVAKSILPVNSERPRIEVFVDPSQKQLLSNMKDWLNSN